MQVDGKIVFGAVVVLVILATALYYTYARTEKKLDVIIEAVKARAPGLQGPPPSQGPAGSGFDL